MSRKKKIQVERIVLGREYRKKRGGANEGKEGFLEESRNRPEKSVIVSKTSALVTEKEHAVYDRDNLGGKRSHRCSTRRSNAQGEDTKGGGTVRRHLRPLGKTAQ